MLKDNGIYIYSYGANFLHLCGCLGLGFLGLSGLWSGDRSFWFSTRLSRGRSGLFALPRLQCFLGMLSLGWLLTTGVTLHMCTFTWVLVLVLSVRLGQTLRLGLRLGLLLVASLLYPVPASAFEFDRFALFGGTWGNKSSSQRTIPSL